jgi:aldose 1-epimerase
MLELSTGDTRILIDDRGGGAIVEYRTTLPGEAIDWLVPAVAVRPSCFPMVPYASRIRDGRFSFGERAIELRPNNPPEPHAIHGHGWQHTWVPSESQIAGSPVGSSLSLEYLHEADDWLWRYRAIQRFELEERRLRITLAVENLSPEPMPVGLGFHPYFPRPSDARVGAEVGGRWRMDADLLPVTFEVFDTGVDSIAVEPTQIVDAVFSEWNQTATIELVDAGARIRMTAGDVFEHLVIYSPAGADFVCVEPVSNVPDAFNLSPSLYPRPLFQTLAPGERLSGWMSIAPELG